jgi:large subunit ribosomal protein L1
VILIAEKTTIDAVQKALDASKSQERKFAQTIDLAIMLKNVDLAVPKNRIDEDVILPKGRGKPAKVGVFAAGDGATKARKVADLVISPEEFDSYTKNKRAFKRAVNGTTYFLAEAPLMANIGKTLGVVLGPRGKMPRPIPPGADPTPQVNNLRNTVKVRSKDKKVFHCVVGADAMKVEDIAENIEAVLKRVESKLEHGRMNLGAVYVKTSMGPSVRLV